jgi:hypothetical protein
MDGNDWKDGSQSEETRHVNFRAFVSKTNCTGLKATTTLRVSNYPQTLIPSG